MRPSVTWPARLLWFLSVLPPPSFLSLSTANPPASWQREGAPVKRAVAGLFVGPLYQSPSDARLAHLCGANVLTTGTRPHLMRGCHHHLTLRRDVNNRSGAASDRGKAHVHQGRGSLRGGWVGDGHCD